MLVKKGRGGSMWLLAAVCAAGCGGGQQGGEVTASAHTAQGGGAVFTYFGQPKPQLTTSAGSVSVLGQAGATFSSIVLEPPPNLNDTYIAFSRDLGGTGALYKLPYAGGGAQLLCQPANGAYNVGISSYGTVIFNESGPAFPFTIRNDGTGLKGLTFTGAASAQQAQYSVDGTNRVVFDDEAGHVYIAPGAGGAATLVQSNEESESGGPCWNPAGTEIAYQVSVGGGNNDIFVTSTSGGTPTDATPAFLRNTGIFFDPTWSADGVTIAAVYVASGANDGQIVKFNISEPNTYVQISPNGVNDLNPSFSPDGSKLVFGRFNNGGATPGIYICDAAGGNQSIVLPDPSAEANSVNGGIAWSPFLPKETVVASTGSTFYHEPASGFLLTQNGDQFGSLVAFTANTPADAAIQAPTTNSQTAPMLFTLTGDSITEVGYTNSYFSPGTILTFTLTPSVVVSIDAVTGQVDLVAPAATPKAAPAAKNADGTLTYNCKFKAIYDGKGKNLAPSGASQIVVNPKTGKLVSFR